MCKHKAYTYVRRYTYVRTCTYIHARTYIFTHTQANTCIHALRRPRWAPGRASGKRRAGSPSRTQRIGSMSVHARLAQAALGAWACIRQAPHRQPVPHTAHRQHIRPRPLGARGAKPIWPPSDTPSDTPSDRVKGPRAAQGREPFTKPRGGLSSSAFCARALGPCMSRWEAPGAAGKTC